MTEFSGARHKAFTAGTLSLDDRSSRYYAREKPRLVTTALDYQRVNCFAPVTGKYRRIKRGIMANIISDATIEYVGILAKLELSDEEKEAAKSDMGRMLDYIDMLGELDTDNVEPMSHAFPVQNVFREDVVTGTDIREQILANAPEEKNGMFVVPKTFD